MDTLAYGVAEAARYLKIAPATLRSWVVGRSYPKGEGDAYFEPLIQLPEEETRLLSFNNLIEAYALRSLRREHGVSINAVRKAIDYAESKLNIPRLLLSHDLLTTAGDLFVQRYGELINLSRSGQLALRKILEAHLRRIDWKGELPVRLYPYFEHDYDKLIAIDPSIQFGRPVLIRKGISTSVIADRIDAGESVEFIAADYDIARDEVELAIMYERAA
jgi:uncharacterized protein (DUF433 family)